MYLVFLPGLFSYGIHLNIFQTNAVFPSIDDDKDKGIL